MSARTDVDAALQKVRRIRSHTPSWNRWINEMATTATKSAEPAQDLPRARALEPPFPPHEATGLLDPNKLADHGESLITNLKELEVRWVQLMDDTASAHDVQSAAAGAHRAADRVVQHCLFLIYLDEVRHDRVGARKPIAEFCDQWSLSKAQINQIWQWVCADAPSARFADGAEQPLVVDTDNRRVYRKPRGFWQHLYTNTAFLYGAGIVFMLLIALQALLHRTNSLLPKPHNWLAELAVVVLCVIAGALLHVAAKGLSGIHFDDKLSVYEAGEWTDWLALRWLAILRLYIPVLVVAGGLWVTGTRAGTLKDLSIAVLAGYGADSLMINGLTKIKEDSGETVRKLLPQAGKQEAGEQPSGGAGDAAGAAQHNGDQPQSIPVHSR